MQSIIIWNDVSSSEQEKLLERPISISDPAITQTVRDVIAQVRTRGDAALKQLTKQYDQVELNNFAIAASEIEHAYQSMSSDTLDAMQQVMQNLHAFHAAQQPQPICVTTAPGIVCEQRFTAIERIGLYIPGGSAPLVSTVFMLGIPARIAACPIRILCSPPNRNGHIDPYILAAAKLCGIEKIYAVGGAQAIAAMAYGTNSIPKVDKIFGPGNRWVTTAKMLVAQDAAGAMYDLPAGPSEVMIIADHSANPEFVAADLLSQAEHGHDSQVILLSTDLAVIKQVQLYIDKQLEGLSRKEIARLALMHARFILVKDIATAITIANRYAAEHLILQVNEPRNYLAAINEAGSIFLGPWSPESVGDYASGTNHVLPTYGFAKSLSGLSVRDFMKAISVQELTRAGLCSIADSIRKLTEIEGLDGHQRAIDIRINSSQFLENSDE